jgi:hypothetical protein
MTAISAIPRDFGDPLPASLSQAPPHPAFFQLLLKTKAEPQIDAWATLA